MRRGALFLFGAMICALYLSGTRGVAAEDYSAIVQKLAQPGLTIISPLDYQVFQRKTRGEGIILVSGRAGMPCDAVRVRINDHPPGRIKRLFGVTGWTEWPVSRANGGFNGSLHACAGGWYRLEIEALKDGKVVGQRVIEHVGMGEVFVGAGQSNSTNCGAEGPLKQTSGMVSTFSGSAWRLGDDPQPGVHDQTTLGSFWPAFGDAMYEKYHVPIGVAVTGHSGSPIARWQPGEELYNWTMTRIRQLGRGGFRAVMWHQGESDTGLTSEEYATGLARIIRATNQEAGWEFPWFVAQVSYNNAQSPMFPTTRNGQKALWDAHVALEGPDTDTLGGDNRDASKIHFSTKGLNTHGKMWAEKVGVYLDKVLDEK